MASEPLDGDALLDLLVDGAVVADADGVVTHANAVARRLLGTPDPVGRPLRDVMALRDLDGRDWLCVTQPYTGLRIRTAQSEQPWYLPDGTEVLVTARMWRSSPVSPVTRVAVSLRSGRARARLDRERSDLVATIAHELRSPLTGVKGFTGSLLARWDKFSDDQKRLIMETVHADTDRLTRLIAELLEVARIDTGRLTLRARPVDAVRAVSAVVDSVRAGTSREVSFEPAGDLPDLHADPDRLAQVLTNLVDNAVKHGDGHVRITARPHRLPEGAFLQIVVDDEGEGINEDIRRRVFTKFWTNGTRGGTGLGMYIAHGLVTAHGGTIRIDDAPGGGARVEVLWPLSATP